MPLRPKHDPVAVPAAALEFHVERRPAFEARLRMRFFDADLEAGPSVEHRHLRHGAAAHPESHRKTFRLESREIPRGLHH